jgi:cytochrome c
MENFPRTLRALICLMCIGFLAGMALAADRGTEAQAKALVAKAIAAYDAKGKSVFSEMTAPSTAFTDRDLYIFVIGPDHKTVAQDSMRPGSGKTSSLSKMPTGNRLERNSSARRHKRVHGSIMS